MWWLIGIIVIAVIGLFLVFKPGNNATKQGLIHHETNWTDIHNAAKKNNVLVIFYHGKDNKKGKLYKSVTKREKKNPNIKVIWFSQDAKNYDKLQKDLNITNSVDPNEEYAVAFAKNKDLKKTKKAIFETAVEYKYYNNNLEKDVTTINQGPVVIIDAEGEINPLVLDTYFGGNWQKRDVVTNE